VLLRRLFFRYYIKRGYERPMKINRRKYWLARGFALVWAIGGWACSDGILDSGSGTGPFSGTTGGDESRETGIGGDSDSSDTETIMDLTPADEDTGQDVDTAPRLSCAGGASYGGICWFLGEPNQNCFEVCEPFGGYHEDTPKYIGSHNQGGDFDVCYDILTALRRSGMLYGGTRDDELGLGCHRWEGDDYWWLWEPDFDPSHKTYSAQVVCGCNIN
jgi:hypothetical protein